MITLNLLLFLTALLCGLMAGLLYGYDCSVIGGLGKLSDKEYLSAFQSINKAILNPIFFISFIGCLLVMPATTWLSFNRINAASFYLLLGATVVYALGVFGITVLANVPLNEKLAGMNLNNMLPADISKMRQNFEKKWSFYHHIRTMAAIVSFSLVILCCLRK